MAGGSRRAMLGAAMSLGLLAACSNTTGTLLGAPCAAAEDCLVDGMTCDTRGLFPGGLCTATCLNDADCDDGTDFPGVCTGSGETPGICLRGCPAGIAGGCRREGWLCVPGATTAAACLPDCRLGGCPDGATCGDDGACTVAGTTQGEGAACGGSHGGCAAGLRCLTFSGSATATCHAACDDATPCGEGRVCAVDVSDGTRACARTCADDAACDAGARCLDSTAGKRCLPVVLEGSLGEEAVCGREPGLQCGAGLACVLRRPDRGHGLCLAACTDTADCGEVATDCLVPVDTTAPVETVGATLVCTRRCDSVGAYPCPEGARCTYGECLPL